MHFFLALHWTRALHVLACGYSAPGNRIAGMEIHVFRNGNNSQTNAYSHYFNYSYSGLIPNERALRVAGNSGGAFPFTSDAHVRTLFIRHVRVTSFSSACTKSKYQQNIDPFHVRENVSKLEDKTKEI